MNIHLNSQVEALIQQKVSSGLYSSASEVVCEAVLAMDLYQQLQVEKLNKLRQDIRDGLDSGKSTHWDAEEFKILARKVKAGEIKIGSIL